MKTIGIVPGSLHWEVPEEEELADNHIRLDSAAGGRTRLAVAGLVSYDGMDGARSKSDT